MRATAILLLVTSLRGLALAATTSEACAWTSSRDPALSSTQKVAGKVSYHINPATGNIISCSTEHRGACHHDPHYTSHEAARAAREASISTALYHTSAHTTPSLDQALEKVAREGFHRAPPTQEHHFEEQVSLLLEKPAWQHLCKLLEQSTIEAHRLRLARVLAWVACTLAWEQGVDPRRWIREELASSFELEEHMEKVLDALSYPELRAEELLAISASLWVYRDAPYHERTRMLLLSQDSEPTGYIPCHEQYLEKYATRQLCEPLGIKVEDLPQGVMAYDVETDTSRGYGLRPQRTQITDVALATREHTWLLSGDERWLLETLANILNEQHEPLILAGWNNHCFDNIVLQTRAEYHAIPGWRGTLQTTHNATIYSPAGYAAEAQALSWTTPEGLLLEDIDLYQEKILLDQWQGERHTRGLKDFVEHLGCHPVRVDRGHLHQLSKQERTSYVLSDGIATLRAYKALQPHHNDV